MTRGTQEVTYDQALNSGPFCGALHSGQTGLNGNAGETVVGHYMAELVYAQT